MPFSQIVPASTFTPQDPRLAAAMSNPNLVGATMIQRRWVLERINSPSDSQAAIAVGVHRSTVCKWPNKAALDQAVDELRAIPAAQAVAILETNVTKAANAKVNALDSDDERIVAAASTEILDRVLGRAVHRQDVTVHAGAERQERLAALIAAAAQAEQDEDDDDTIDADAYTITTTEQGQL